MHKLAIPVTLLALAGPKLDREMREYRQLRDAQERRNQEIEFICSDVLAQMGFPHQGKQEDNSAVNCELVFGDGSSTGNGSNKFETMQAAAYNTCVYPEIERYKSKQPTPKETACFVYGYSIDFSSDNALFNANSDCWDSGKPPADDTTQGRRCHNIEAVVADVREGMSYGDVACSCVHAEAVVTSESSYEFLK